MSLGSSGSTVTLTPGPNGGYTLDGVPVEAGDEVTAGNGSKYVLSLAPDGSWTATYQAVESVVRLGRLGGTVTLVREEDGGYSTSGKALESGSVVVGRGGRKYALGLQEDGTWTAAHVPEQQLVPVGTSGFLTLTRAEDGVWMWNDQIVADGDRVTVDNGSAYRLQFLNGYWSARFIPMGTTIVGTGLRAIRREDGQGWRVGRISLLPASGEGDVTADDGATYHVWFQDGRLRGVRFDTKPHGTSRSEANFKIGLESSRAALSTDDWKTPLNEDRTTLLVAGGEFSIQALLEKGRSTFNQPDIVVEARKLLQDLRQRAEVLLHTFEEERQALRPHLQRVWSEAQDAVDSIFGSGIVDLKRTPYEEDLLEDLDALIEPLLAEAAFAEATKEDGGGVFEAAALNQNQSRKAYRAARATSEAIMGATGGTRYGAAWTKTRRQDLAVKPLSLKQEGADLGGFAYSTIPDTERTHHVASWGTATYAGGVAAVSGAAVPYTGGIEISVNFQNDTVSGLITSLLDEDGQPWVHTHYGINAIVLPDAKLTRSADWNMPAGPNTAVLLYQDVFLRPEYSRATFRGHLLGTGEDAGSEVVGVWSVGDPDGKEHYIAGGFGALRVVGDTQDPPTPPESTVEDRGRLSETTVAPSGTEIGNAMLTLRGALVGPDLQTTATEEEWDDETLVLDAGRRVEEAYQIPLEEAFARQRSEAAYPGRRIVELAREEIGRLRDQLAVAIRLGADDSALDLRARIWEEINERVRARLFGTADNALAGTDYRNDPGVPATDPRKWSPGYPVERNGRPQDTSALAAVDKVLAALVTQGSLERALGGSGIFTRADREPFRQADEAEIREIWNRAQARIRLWLRSTEYTRFGAWRKQTAPNAWSEYRDRLEDDENGPNSFAYSPLPQTRLGEVRFPAGGAANYTGETVAVQGTTFYLGTLDLSARWHEALQGQDEAGLLTVQIRDLQDDQGDPLTYTHEVGGEQRETAISQVYFGDIAIRVDGESRLYFSEDNPRVAGIEFEDFSLDKVTTSAEPTAAMSVEGKFVGRFIDAPQAVIGTWTLRDRGDARVGTGETLYGGFGAELTP